MEAISGETNPNFAMKTVTMICLRRAIAIVAMIIHALSGNAQFSPVWATEWVSPAPIMEGPSWWHSYVNGLAVTPDGGFVAAGDLMRTDNINSCITRHDSTGTIIWTHYLDGWDENIGGSYQLLVSLDTDGAGNTYVTGYFRGMVDFTPEIEGDDYTQFTIQHSTYLLKLNPEGGVEWVRTLQNVNSSFNVPHAVRVNAEDEVTLVGRYAGAVTLANDANVQWSNPYSGLYLAKFSSEGDCIGH